MDWTTSTPEAETRRHTQLRTILGVGLVAFILGGALAVYFLGTGAMRPTGIFDLKEDAAPAPTASQSQAMPGAEQTPQSAATEAMASAARVQRVAEQQGGIEQRVAAMEQRLTRLDLQAQAAAGNAARAEGLLIAFATRRAIERGAPLGYLADQLRLRFGDARPNSVRTVIEAAQNPVTLDQLLARLDGLAPVLGQVPAKEGALDWISREFAELFVIRSEDTPSPAAENRLERARMFLQSGRTEAAVAEVQHLPNAARAAGWIADAKRYAAAQRALELLETTAILEPRELRDGSGNAVEQPSPAVSGN
ncbi:conserved hypothetical protein [Altererythrobacter sp. B11]|uniref:hypothetical protein n=1 Tax=Altererythrobacter sp. B11 TaxID=2060312 RepID=UPI000DC6E614|nr:hypothetical protein [Altererythrobacter sp. B11]BBC72235.1 conserved hypothetical protein [Altererythrobacter sp. B11]